MFSYFFGKKEQKDEREEIKYIIKAQSFIRKALAVVKKKSIIKKSFLELEMEIENKKSNIFEFYSKKEWRLRSSNDIENKILFDDNSFLFNKHYAFIIKEMNNKFMTRFFLPLKILDYNKSLKFTSICNFKDFVDFDSNVFQNEFYCYNGQISLNADLFGFGSLLLPTNIIVSGIFNNGLLLSPARIYYQNGDYYEGEIKQIKVIDDNKEAITVIPFGKGDMYYKQKSKYDCLKLKANFTNHYKVKDGLHTSFYEKMICIVEFSNNIASDHGTILFNDFSIFYGNFSITSKNSKIRLIDGVLRLVDGRIFQGNFKEGIVNGLGIQFEPEGYKKNRNSSFDATNYTYFNTDVDFNDKNSNIDPAPTTITSKLESINSLINSNISEHETYKILNTKNSIKSNVSNLENVLNQYNNSSFELKPINVKELDNNLIWGKGTYSKGNFINGKLEGTGLIITDKHILMTVWRHGIIIKSVPKMRTSRKLDKNIFKFLNFDDLNVLIEIKQKSTFDFFNSNENGITTKLLFLKIFSQNFYDLEHDINFGNKKFLIKKDIFKNSSKGYSSKISLQKLSQVFKNQLEIGNSSNIDSILKSCINKKISLLPLIPFETNGGVVGYNHHYKNIFDPNITNCYYTSFYNGDKNDFCFNAKYDYNLEEYFKNLQLDNIINMYNDNNEISNNHNYFIHNNFLRSHSISSYNFNHHYLFKESTLKNTQNGLTKTDTKIIESIESLRNSLNLEKQYFLQYLPYDYNYEIMHLRDEKVLQIDSLNKDVKCIFNPSVIFIDNRFKAENNLTVMHNPVRTLLIYISKTKIDLSEIENDCLNHKYLSLLENKEIPFHLEKLGYNVIKAEENTDNCIVEVDSNNYDNTHNLVAYISLNNATKHYIKLTDFMHLGNYLCIKLVDQNVLKGFKATTIDIVSFLTLGRIIKN